MRSTFFAQAVVGLIAAATTDAASLQQRAAACAQLPAGSGPKPEPDTVPAFLALPAFPSAANGASTPAAYVKQYGNLQGASIITNQYLGVSFLKSYDVSACAAKCNAAKGCNSFNLYFERDPSQEPGSGNSGCANPCSTTNIKCALFAGSVTASSATNKGQFRNKFQVAIAGSNGYTNALYLVSQARGEIGQPGNSAQPFCSSILGYTTPIVTTTLVATSTPLITTSTTGVQTNLATITVTVPSTTTITNTLSTTTTVILPTTTIATQVNSVTTTIIIPTTTIVPTTTTIETVTLSFPTTIFTTTTAASIVAVTKRQVTPLVTPSVLSKYPGSIITSACSLAVSPVTKTSTVTRTRTSTISTVTATSITSITTAITATAFASTTVNTFVSTTKIGTVITTPIITVTATVISTVTQIDAPTITVTNLASETATTSTTPIVTVVATATPAPPVCTADYHYFQVVGGAYNGLYVFSQRNGDDPNLDVVFTHTPTAWSLSSDGAVYLSPTRAFSWSSRPEDPYYILASTEAAKTANQFFTTYCSIQPSSAVFSVPGATGQLVCRRTDGTPTRFVTCAGYGETLLQTATDVFCEELAIAAIPVTLAC